MVAGGVLGAGAGALQAIFLFGGLFWIAQNEVSVID
jgi:hypothetical protein